MIWLTTSPVRRPRQGDRRKLTRTAAARRALLYQPSVPWPNQPSVPRPMNPLLVSPCIGLSRRCASTPSSKFTFPRSSTPSL